MTSNLAEMNKYETNLFGIIYTDYNEEESKKRGIDTFNAYDEHGDFFGIVEGKNLTWKEVEQQIDEYNY